MARRYVEIDLSEVTEVKKQVGKILDTLEKDTTIKPLVRAGDLVIYDTDKLREDLQDIYDDLEAIDQ